MLEVPDPAIAGGVKEQVIPVVGIDVTLRETLPLKDSTGVTVITEDPEVPDAKVKLEGLALTVKSCTVIMIVTERERDPLVPLTVTLYAPDVPEQDSIEV